MALSENIFPLTSDNLPLEAEGDAHGNILFFCQQYGWLVASWSEAEECLIENNCTHWTFTPDPPN